MKKTLAFWFDLFSSMNGLEKELGFTEQKPTRLVITHIL